jgi:small acid-soluble spore protein (thioredoxin-like protein)
MEPNPDNRADNVDRIQHSINMTIDNIHRANEMIEKTSDQCQRRNFFDPKRRSEMTHIAGHPTAGISAGGTVWMPALSRSFSR